MTTVDSYFGRSFVINLDDQVERWENAVEQFERFGIENYERFPALRPDPQSLPEMWYEKMNFDATWVRNPSAYIRGQCGLKQGHVAIIEKAKCQGLESVLIFEDDFVFSKRFPKKFAKQLPRIEKIGWDMLYLGVRHKKPGTRLSRKLSRVNCGYHAHAYAIRREMYDFVIDNAMESGREIDVFYALHAHSKFNCIAFDPAIAVQDSTAEGSQTNAPA